MLRFLYLSFLLVFSAILFIGCSKKSREGVAVIVNGYEISSTEVLQTAELLRRSMVSAFPERAVEGVTKDLMAGAAQQLVANRLLLEEAQQRGITASAVAVDSAYDRLLDQFPDKAAFERQLTAMGETDSGFRAQLAEGVQLEGLMKILLKDIPRVDSQQCRDFYEKNRDKYTEVARVRASQIFFPFPESITEEQKKQLQVQAGKIHEELKSGADFSEYAGKYSKGPGADSGGDIGWFKRGDLRPELETPLFLLKKDETSDIITTDAGLHILRKSDEEAEKQQSFEEVEKRVRLLMEIKERNERIGRHIDSLIATAKVEYIDTSLAQGPSMKDLGSLPPVLQQ